MFSAFLITFRDGLEAALIVGLLINRAKRCHGEAVATLIADLSARFINLPTDKVDPEIEAAQRSVCESMGLDLSTLWQWTDGSPRFFKMTHLYRPLGGPPTPERFDAQAVFPWCLEKLQAGKVISVFSMDTLPAEAGRDRESWLHFGIYITVMYENYPMPEMPGNVKEGIVKGMYKFKASDKKNFKMKAQLFGSGTIMNEVLNAAQILEEEYKVAADVRSITSYKELRREALEAERWNLLNPNQAPKESYISKMIAKEDGVFVASSDYVKALPDSISKWFPRTLYSLGTDGFGRSESREALRDFFEVDAKHIVLAGQHSRGSELFRPLPGAPSLSQDDPTGIR